MKLLYFDFPVRAEAARLALHAGGVAFEDKRITMAEWPALKAGTPRGQIPTLTLPDGTVLTESLAILRYAGASGSPRLYPSDPLAAVRVDEAVDILNDVLGALTKTFGKPVDVQKKMGEELLAADGAAGKAFAWVEAALAQRNSLYIVGDSMTIAECMLKTVADWVTVDLAGGAFASALAAYPAVARNVAMASAVPGIKKYEAARMQTRASTEAVAVPLKLLYFDFPVRAEAVRLALHAGGVAFEDKRITMAEWPALKAGTPRGQIPTLTLPDGTVLTESLAILRYAGASGSPRLYPSDPLAAVRVDEAVDILNDVLGALTKTFGKPVDVQKKMGEELLAADGAAGKAFAWVEAALAQRNSLYIVGDSMTIAECMLKTVADWVTVDLAGGAFASALAAYPAVVKIVALTSSVAAIKKYEAGRKKAVKASAKASAKVSAKADASTTSDSTASKARRTSVVHETVGRVKGRLFAACFRPSVESQ